MAFTAIIVPLIQILTLLYVLVPLRLGRVVRGQNLLFRMLTALRPWGLTEVFMLGAVVALVKLSAQAEVSPQVSLVAYGLLMIVDRGAHQRDAERAILALGQGTAGRGEAGVTALGHGTEPRSARMHTLPGDGARDRRGAIALSALRGAAVRAPPAQSQHHRGFGDHRRGVVHSGQLATRDAHA